jgi:hypothetical protein
MSSDVVIPSLLRLPDGLIGIPDLRFLDAVPIAGGQFLELLARDEPGLGWLAASAEDVRPGMTATLRATGRVEPDEILIVLLASHGDPAVVTANLAGPLAVSADGDTRQIVLEEPSFELRARLGRLAPVPVERS